MVLFWRGLCFLMADHKKTCGWRRCSGCIYFCSDRPSRAEPGFVDAENICSCFGFMGWSRSFHSSWWARRQIFLFSPFSIVKCEALCTWRSWPLSSWWQARFGSWKTYTLVGFSSCLKFWLQFITIVLLSIKPRVRCITIFHIHHLFHPFVLLN